MMLHRRLELPHQLAINERSRAGSTYSPEAWTSPSVHKQKIHDHVKYAQFVTNTNIFGQMSLILEAIICLFEKYMKEKSV